MEYISVSLFAGKLGISERTVRNWCAEGKIDGAFLTGKTWSIPKDASIPERKSATRICPLLSVLREQKKMYYYRGLKNWPAIPGYLRDTCLTAQDNYALILDYFKIRHK